MAKRGRSPEFDAPTAKCGRPPKDHEPRKATGCYDKLGQLQKSRNKIKSHMSALSLCPSPAIHPPGDQGAPTERGERLDTDIDRNN
ncbi:hypothetical protein RRF57_004681 [Xylaria bambusicola]|uniref:Uncharacterized protein n=1 Tax=Xylaria bambusicola TaxID=326684 RepID=A0AAN7UM80_9PEZI